MILIIYAHPKTKGHNFLVLKEAKRLLKDKGVKCEVLDLYKMKYDPVMHENEHYVSGNRKISSVNKKIQEKIKKSEKLLFIYPIWWNSMPAILKGFFDKVLTPGFAFNFGKNGLPIKHLKGKKAATIITHGGPSVFSSLILFNRGAKIVTKDTLGFSGIRSKYFKIGNCKQLNETQKNKIKRTVKKAIGYLLR